jgi:hypothetical protein
MKKSVHAGRRVQRKNALATKRRSRRDAKRNQIYSNVQEMAPKSAAIVRSGPKLRITPPMQAQIIALFVKGHSLSEISRQTHRARQTVTKVVRAPDIQAMIQEQREKLVAEADSWRESLAFVVQTELHGEMAFRLAQAFGIVPVIPRPHKKTKPAMQDSWEGVDRETLAKARILGQVAQERASAMRLENDQLEELAQKEHVQSNRKSSRLFDCRD